MSNAVIAITCPGCECAVRPLDDTPCPECRRCPFCGQKLKRTDEHCPVGHVGNPESVAWLEREFGIRADDVPRQRRRYAIRKKLAGRKAFTCFVVVLGWVIVSEVYHDLAGERTSAYWVGLAITFVSYALTATVLFQRIFRRMEDRRLAAEFPPVDDKGAHGSP